ncbi:lamin tail domain-containing protein [uncultured Winogradskyella sp.]|uniref:lamin tail domain-containing protein n=1 Tax=uncultured Winogradskyella sp. TaxID=395353 RepID=UPI0035133C50
MKKLYFTILSIVSMAISFGQDMVITGAFDGPLTGGTPKAVEIYVINDIPDLTLHGFGSANNGGGTDGVELTFAGSANAGDFIYITDSAADFNTYFGFAADYESAAASVNGDDALELFFDGNVIDTFGDINTDGTGEPWDYLDGWAYRNNSTGPDGTNFNLSNWFFSGTDATDGCTTNNTCASVFPIGSFVYSGNPCGVSFGSATYNCQSSTIGDNNDGVIVEIPYTGSNNTIISISAPGATLGGDDPALTADGTITLTGLNEGDAWSITLNGGDCDGTTTSGTVPAAECDPTPNTCFDLSGGAELFELVTVTPNSGFSNNGTWENNAGVYSANGFCGGGCVEPVESWLIFGPLDMSGVSDLDLLFDAAENFGTTDLVVAYTTAYSGCPSGTSWTTAQTITDAGSVAVDLSSVTGTDVFIGIQYVDDGADGYSDWELSNVRLASFSTCPTLGSRPVSNCAICDLTLQTENYVCVTNTAGDNNDNVTVEIPYTGVESTITSVTSTTATVGGDDPSTIADGVITLSGLSEGDAWDITINGGDCDGTTLSGTVAPSQCDPVALVINEINADPSNDPNGEGDANGDGVADFSDDEFVEIYNTGSTSIDLSDYTLSDATSVRHTFPAGTILPANSFITVFGGGTPTGISGLVQTASSGALGLNNGGDTVTITNSSAVEIISETYVDAGNNQSIGRSPDFTGAFVDHSTIAGNGGALFSPNSENDATLSIDDSTTQNFSLSPNPTNSGFVTITTALDDTINVEVFDMLGKQVKKAVIQPNTNLDVSQLRSGIYIVRLEQNNATTTKKLVIR